MFSDPGALIQGFIGPDIQDLAGRPDIAFHDHRNRRMLGALGQRGLPPWPVLAHLADGHQIAPKLIEGAEVSRLHLRRYGPGVIYFDGHVDDEFGCGWRPALEARRSLAHSAALGGVLVRPDVNDLIKGADLGTEKPGQLGQGLALLIAVTKALDHLGQRPWLEIVGTDFVNHEFPL